MLVPAPLRLVGLDGRLTYLFQALLEESGLVFPACRNTPLAFKDRLERGQMGDLQDVMSRWQPWIPPKPAQGLQQVGGAPHWPRWFSWASKTSRLSLSIFWCNCFDAV